MKALGREDPSSLLSPKMADSLTPSQLSKSYISAAELVQDYFFQGLASRWIKVCIFLAGKAGKAEYVVNLKVQILSSLIAYKKASGHAG